MREEGRRKEERKKREEGEDGERESTIEENIL